ncbi:MAG: MFS transporter [Dysgonamonadaceae bacterium]|jgi:MFS family permease|nr:MFS transporter [Dysgonamonadaceae bacterium]
MNNTKNYPWLVVAMLWFVALLNYMDRQMLSTMRPSMMVDIADLVSAANFGRLMAVFLWVYALMSPISGLIADRLNRKWLIVGSLFTWSSVTLLMGYTTDFNQLYILRAVMGISEAFYIPAGLSLIADYHQGKTRSIAVGFHTSGIYLGQALGGFGAVVAGNFSWQTTFHSFGLLGMLYCIVLLLFLKEKKTYTVSTERQSFKSELSGMGKALVILFGNLSFWVILFYFSAPSLPGWATKNWLPTLFSESLGINMEQAGPMSTIAIAMASLFGVLLGGYLSDKWVNKNLKGRIYTGVIGLFLTLPALFLLAFGNDLPMIASGAICFGLGFGMFDVNSMPILCQFVSSRYRATAYGLMNLVGISSGAVITNFMGKSIDAGNITRDFILMAAVVAIAIVLNLMILKPKVIDKKDECNE